MPTTKNTLKIAAIKEWINKQLERTDEFADDKFKAGMCHVLEHILTEANRYHGYTDNYWIRTGCHDWMAAGEPGYPEKEAYIYGPTGQKYNRHYY